MAYKILLVEDEALVHEMYSLALKKKGYEIDLATDGEQALQKLTAPQVDYDLILLDVMMPKLDGISILRKIKKPDSPAKNIPTFLLTNLGLDDVVKEAKSLGAVKCLIKSNTLPQQIIDEIEDFFKNKSAQPATATPNPTTQPATDSTPQTQTPSPITSNPTAPATMPTTSPGPNKPTQTSSPNTTTNPNSSTAPSLKPTTNPNPTSATTPPLPSKPSPEDS